MWLRLGVLVTVLAVVTAFSSTLSSCFIGSSGDSPIHCVRFPVRLDAKQSRRKKEKSVDYVAVQKALRTLPTKNEPKDRELVPACKYSTTYGCDKERLMLNGQRVLYRNGRVGSASREWEPHAGALAPHLYDMSDPIMMRPEDEDDEHPQMIIDEFGRPWRAEHVLEELGLERNKMGYPENEVVEEMGQATLVPIPWDGPVTTADMKKVAFSKKLRGESSLGSELDDERWLVHYTKLVNFRARYGHADVPLMWAEDRALGRWVCKQRDLYSRYERNNYYQHEILPGGQFGRKVNTLSPWRIQMLYDAGFSFKLMLRWEDRLVQLSQFFVRHGHARVPCSDNLDVSDEEFPGLYSWLQQQKTAYQLWKKDIPNTSMTQEKIVLLEKLGVDLSPLESSWDSRLDQLRQFQAEHRHVRVAKSQDFELACWLIHQRKQYPLYNSKTPWESSLTSDEMDELNEMGMDWDPLETRWQEQFNTLQAFANKHGHCNVPSEYPENQSLAFCVQRQRRDYKDRVTRLTMRLSLEA